MRWEETGVEVGDVVRSTECIRTVRNCTPIQ